MLAAVRIFGPFAGVGWVCNLMRLRAGRCVRRMRRNSANKGDFVVLRFGAVGCQSFKTDFKSPAYAIPPRGRKLLQKLRKDYRAKQLEAPVPIHEIYAHDYPHEMGWW